MMSISIVVLCLAAACIDATSPTRPPPPPPPERPTPPPNRVICDNCLEGRFMQHYAAKGCLPNKRAECLNDCVESYRCPIDQPPAYGGEFYDKCEYGGKFYSVGDQVTVGNPCRVSCSCRDTYSPTYNPDDPESVKPRPSIRCINPECPEQVFGRKPWDGQEAKSPEDLQRLAASCYFLYNLDRCCAGKASCPTEVEMANITRCSYKSKNYLIGQIIYPDDPCQKCLCDDKWNENDLTQSTCRPIQCDFDLKIDDLRRGCAPVYHQAHCCPIDYECPESVPEQPAAVQEDPVPQPPPGFVIRRVEPTCKFGDNRYALGQLFQPKPCVDCTCKVPPELTCLRRSCPPRPGPHCVIAAGQEDACCPAYDCTSKQINLVTVTATVPPPVTVLPIKIADGVAV